MIPLCGKISADISTSEALTPVFHQPVIVSFCANVVSHKSANIPSSKGGFMNLNRLGFIKYRVYHINCPDGYLASIPLESSGCFGSSSSSSSSSTTTTTSTSTSTSSTTIVSNHNINKY